MTGTPSNTSFTRGVQRGSYGTFSALHGPRQRERCGAGASRRASRDRERGG